MNTTLLFPPSLQALACVLLLSVSVNFAALGNSCKWNHTVSVFLWLVYFIWYKVFKFHSCFSMFQNLLLF